MSTPAPNGQVVATLPAVNQMAGMNHQMLLDQMFSSYMMSYMMKMTQSEGGPKLSKQTLMYLFFVFSIGEIKELIKYMLTQFKNTVSSKKGDLWGAMTLLPSILMQGTRQLAQIRVWRRKTPMLMTPPLMPEEEIVEVDPLADSQIILKLDVPANVLAMLLDFCRESSQTPVITEEISLKYTNLAEAQMKTQIPQLEFEIPGLARLQCLNQIQLSRRLQADEEILSDFLGQKEKEKQTVTKYESLWDLIPDPEISKFMRERYENLMTTTGGRNHPMNHGYSNPFPFYNYVYPLMSSHLWTSAYNAHYCFMEMIPYQVLKRVLKFPTPNLNHDGMSTENNEWYSQCSFLGCLFYGKRSTNCRAQVAQMVSAICDQKKLHLPEYGIEVPIDLPEEEFATLCAEIRRYYGTTNDHSAYHPVFGTNSWNQVRSYYPNTINELKALQAQSQKKMIETSDLEFRLTPFSPMPREDLIQGFHQFVQKLIQEHTSIEHDEKDIYLLKLEYEDIEEKIANPAYEKYIKEKAKIKEMAQELKSLDEPKKAPSQEATPEAEQDSRHPNYSLGPSGHHGSHGSSNHHGFGGGFGGGFHDRFEDRFSLRKMYFKMADMDVPPEMITVRRKEMKIIKKHIRKFQKPIDTLYLREKDQKRLSGILKTFKRRNEIFTELGIPKKLGLLAHGVPGTGKTTTIQAIATELHLDIYYLDLNGITKNSELKALFEYVMKENVGGGMIVFEDIDAMTPVVLKRDEEYASTTMAELQKDELSLAYLLNLLDGTLCAEDTVFAITTNHKEVLDPALYRVGRVDVDIQFQLADHFQMQSIYHRILGRRIPEELLAMIPENEITPAEIISYVVHHIYDPTAHDAEILEPFLRGYVPTDLPRITPEQDRVLREVFASETVEAESAIESVVEPVVESRVELLEQTAENLPSKTEIPLESQIEALV